MTVYGVFDHAGITTPLWTTRELAEAAAEAIHGTVWELEVQGDEQPDDISPRAWTAA